MKTSARVPGSQQVTVTCWPTPPSLVLDLLSDPTPPAEPGHLSAASQPIKVGPGNETHCYPLPEDSAFPTGPLGSDPQMGLQPHSWQNDPCPHTGLGLHSPSCVPATSQESFPCSPGAASSTRLCHIWVSTTTYQLWVPGPICNLSEYRSSHL